MHHLRPGIRHSGCVLVRQRHRSRLFAEAVHSHKHVLVVRRSKRSHVGEIHLHLVHALRRHKSVVASLRPVFTHLEPVEVISYVLSRNPLVQSSSLPEGFLLIPEACVGVLVDASCYALQQHPFDLRRKLLSHPTGLTRNSVQVRAGRRMHSGDRWAGACGRTGRAGTLPMRLCRALDSVGGRGAKTQEPTLCMRFLAETLWGLQVAVFLLRVGSANQGSGRTGREGTLPMGLCRALDSVGGEGGKNPQEPTLSIYRRESAVPEFGSWCEWDGELRAGHFCTRDRGALGTAPRVAMRSLCE